MYLCCVNLRVKGVIKWSEDEMRDDYGILLKEISAHKALEEWGGDLEEATAKIVDELMKNDHEGDCSFTTYSFLAQRLL